MLSPELFLAAVAEVEGFVVPVYLVVRDNLIFLQVAQFDIAKALCTNNFGLQPEPRNVFLLDGSHGVCPSSLIVVGTFPDFSELCFLFPTPASSSGHHGLISPFFGTYQAGATHLLTHPNRHPV